MEDQPPPEKSVDGADASPRGDGKDGKVRFTDEVRGWLKSLFFALVLVLIFRTHIAEGYQIKGASMEPTLSHADRLFVEKLSHHFRPYRGGDIVVFPHPHEGKKLIKRVAAVGGQTVEIRDGKLMIDGEFQEELYIAERNRDRRDWGPEVVPEGMLFVLGDNRAHSNDSRNGPVGMVKEAEVVGRAFLRFWPLKKSGIFP